MVLDGSGRTDIDRKEFCIIIMNSTFVDCRYCGNIYYDYGFGCPYCIYLERETDVVRIVCVPLC